MNSEYIQRIIARFLISLGSFALLTGIYYKVNYDIRYVNWFASARFALLITIVLTIRYTIKMQRKFKE